MLGKFGLHEPTDTLSFPVLIKRIFGNFKIFSVHTHDGQNSVQIPCSSILKEKVIINDWVCDKEDEYFRCLKLSKPVDDTLFTFYAVEATASGDVKCIHIEYPHIDVLDEFTIKVWAQNNKPLLMVAG